MRFRGRDFAPKEESIPVSKLDGLISWGLLMQANNEIYTKSVDELNEDWIEKVKELKKGELK